MCGNHPPAFVNRYAEINDYTPSNYLAVMMDLAPQPKILKIKKLFTIIVLLKKF